MAAEVDALAGERSAPFADVVDLGCGTGLCGPLIRRHCGKLTGIDLSPGMLRKAAALEVYDFLVEGELVGFLNSDLPIRFDLAVCVDTLCYLGDLQPFMDALFSALKPGGLLIASVEHLSDPSGPDYRVDPTGRYAHMPAYLRRSAEAAGLAYAREKNRWCCVRNSARKFTASSSTCTSRGNNTDRDWLRPDSSFKDLREPVSDISFLREVEQSCSPVCPNAARSDSSLSRSSSIPWASG
ncbi:methyltransferase domain-containing protein [Roseibium salinum]|nr:methyltransferase domain-containing protein [Roseibium salinum]